MDEWISVDDRLPEPNVSVLCFYQKSRKWRGYLISSYIGTEYGVPLFRDDPFFSITHWRPLPEPPEEPESLKYRKGRERSGNFKGCFYGECESCKNFPSHIGKCSKDGKVCIYFPYDVGRNDVDMYEKAEKETTYHLSCPSCGYVWWSKEAFPDECPCCGIDRTIEENT